MASRVCRRLTSLRGQVLMVGQCHQSKCCAPIASAVRLKSSSNKEKDFSSLIQPLSVKPTNSSDDINVGAELTGHLKKGDCSVQWARVWGEPRPGHYLGPVPILTRTRTNSPVFLDRCQQERTCLDSISSPKQSQSGTCYNYNIVSRSSTVHL